MNSRGAQAQVLQSWEPGPLWGLQASEARVATKNVRFLGQAKGWKEGCVLALLETDLFCDFWICAT